MGRSVRVNICLPPFYNDWFKSRMTSRGIGRSEVIRKMVDDFEGRGVRISTPARAQINRQLNTIVMTAKIIRLASKSPDLARAAQDLDAAAAKIVTLLLGEV